MSKLVTWGIVAIVVVIGALAIFSQSGSGGRLLRIGVIVPLTGSAASQGESGLRAIQVAASEVNASGGIQGKAIELVVEDGGCDAAVAGAAAQKLVTIDNVKVIIGGGCSSETVAAAAFTEPAQVILISPSSSSPTVTTLGDFVFRTYPSDILAGKIAAAYAWGELGSRKAAIFSEDTDYAEGLRDVFREAFTRNGGTIVFNESYVTGTTTDFRAEIAAMKAAKPDIVYFVPQTAASGLAIGEALKAGGIKARLLTGEVLLDREVIAANAATLEGIIGVEAAVDWEENAEAKKFREAHRAMFEGRDPGLFSANAYDAVKLIAEGLTATGVDPIDTEKLRDWLYAVKDWYGASGSISMDENGDPIMGEGVRKISRGDVLDLGTYIP